MDNVALGIVIIIAGLIVLTIILKLCTKFVYLRYFLMVAAAVATMAVSFAMPESDVTFDLNWAAGQFISIFAFSVFTFAEMAFDKEDYIEREYRDVDDRTIEITDRPRTRSLFWTALGSSAAIAAILVVLNYVFFPTNAIALGVVGCIALVWTIISIIKFARWNYRLKHGPKDYY